MDLVADAEVGGVGQKAATAAALLADAAVGPGGGALPQHRNIGGGATDANAHSRMSIQLRQPSAQLRGRRRGQLLQQESCFRIESWYAFFLHQCRRQRARMVQS